jgi:hypothetical protein
MSSDAQREKAANSAAEEVLRIIYGDDLEGCAVNLDSIATVVRSALDEQAALNQELAELHEKGFEAIQLLSTPPPDGEKLSPEDLRSLLGERLDKIQTLSSRIVAATKAEQLPVDDLANDSVSMP